MSAKIIEASREPEDPPLMKILDKYDGYLDLRCNVCRNRKYWFGRKVARLVLFRDSEERYVMDKKATLEDEEWMKALLLEFDKVVPNNYVLKVWR